MSGRIQALLEDDSAKALHNIADLTELSYPLCEDTAMIIASKDNVTSSPLDSLGMARLRRRPCQCPAIDVHPGIRVM